MAEEQEDCSIKLAEVLRDEHKRIHGDFDPHYFKDILAGLVGVRSIPAIHRQLLRREQWALCLSGGGIRSATFGLGVIEGLAGLGLLKKFHYLSTVSGGGYVGSWLTSWIHRHDHGFAGVIKDLNEWIAEPPAAEDGHEHKPPISPEPDAIRHLRKYSNYLTPKLGALSADTWTGVATYLRNLLLLWLVLLPLLVLGLLVPRFATAFVTLPRFLEQQDYVARDGWIGLATALVFLFGVICLLFSISVVGVNRPSSVPAQSRDTLDQSSFLRQCLGPALLAAVALSIAWAWLPNEIWCGLPGRNALVGEPQATAGQRVRLPAMIGFAAIGIALRCLAWLIWLWKAIRQRNATPLAERKPLFHPGFELLAATIAGLFGGLFIWLIACILFPDPLSTRMEGQEQIGLIAAYATFSAPTILGAFLISETLYVGISSFYTSDDDREWWGRSGAWLLIAVVVWIAFAGISLYGPALLVQLNQWGTQWVLSTGGLAGAAGVVAAKFGSSPMTSAAPGKKNPKMELAMAVLPLVFIIILLAFLALAADWAMSLGHAGATFLVQLCLSENIDLRTVTVTAGALIVVCLFMSFFVNINKFSLHAMYRYRIIRAYLGASNLHRNPNRFTGFDDKDNIYMRELWPSPHAKRQDSRQPFHIVNIALNLVSGSNYAWQERKAAPFTVSPLHSGSWYLGYRSSAEYGNPDGGISLGTAVAISGAAASPNMGYHSSPTISFLMTLFNVRLGWWLGNPRKRKAVWREQGPIFMITPLLRELFALTDSKSPYVYLSDGGHFDNLGLYEMVLRRCRLIVVSDASADPNFEFFDLGMAIRKIRIDLGVEIEMEPLPLCLARDKLRDPKAAIPEGSRYAAMGHITYPESPGEPGCLIYLKPGVYGDESADVQDYAVKHKDFPHDTTADQWFDESQFESYRRLGQFVITAVFGKPSVPPVEYQLAQLQEIMRKRAAPAQAPPSQS